MAGYGNHHAGSIAEGIAIREAKRLRNQAKHDAIRDMQNLRTLAGKSNMPLLWDDHDMVTPDGYPHCENPF